MSQPGMGRLSRKGIGGPQRVRLEPHPTPHGLHCSSRLNWQGFEWSHMAVPKPRTGPAGAV